MSYYTVTIVEDSQQDSSSDSDFVPETIKLPPRLPAPKKRDIVIKRKGPLCCIVCLHYKVTYVCLPCGHAKVCLKCLRQSKRAIPKDVQLKCCVCRVPIDSVAALYT